MARTHLIGVDISDSSIKVLQLSSRYDIRAYGKSRLNKGVVENGLIVDADAFAEKVEELLTKTKPHRLHPSNEPLESIVSLPESQLYIHYFVLPETIKNDGVTSYVKDEAAKVIPFTLQDMYWTYHMVRERGLRHVTFVGAPKDAVSNYTHALTKAGIAPAAIGGSFFSLGRALLPQDMGDENFLIVDIGSHATHIGIFDFDAIANLSVRVRVGAYDFTHRIKTVKKVPWAKAEKMKIKDGLKSRSKYVRESLKECLGVIIREVQKARTYYEEKTGHTITKMILAGGSGDMPGLLEHMRDALGIEVIHADPLQKIQNTELLEANVSPLVYANVIGLALRAANEDLPGIDLLSQYRKDAHGTQHRFTFRTLRSMTDGVAVLYALRRLLGSIYKKLPFQMKHIDTKLVVSFIFTGAALLFLLSVVLLFT